MLAMPTCTHDFGRLQVYRDHTTWPPRARQPRPLFQTSHKKILKVLTRSQSGPSRFRKVLLVEQAEP